ncbi:uncharacterized protein LOC127007127 isoform X2 [Eriocheir sinensis]|uniref:uncharacterized protein LOC127007127 isoform X2 n=1 Tax=Eriocheir sinensis TaxID=95602 RepID=UPI0021C60F60|nr:uncharacterized protein LOC127007127 isoform X2 [Eriocheir sinensis]XP_050733725.1 uncharacterized protein LOC127007127 isoform X2 [Eriocheir sinensis]
MRLDGPRLTWEPIGSVNPMRGSRHLSTPHPDSLPTQGRRRRSRSLQSIHDEEGCVGKTQRDSGLSSTSNAMKQAMKGSRGDAGRRRRSQGGDVMGGGRSSSSEGGEERRKPHALPPLAQKPRTPAIAASPLENELASHFIGSPPPSGLRRSDCGYGLSVDSVGEEEGSGGEEERTVYRPTDPSLEASQPKITLNTAPRRGSPPPPHAIVSAENITSTPTSAISLRCLASAATETLALHQALTPPPKLVTYRAQGGADAVQEWVPDEDGGLATPPRKCSSPSIRDLPSPLLGRSALGSRPPPPLQSTRRTSCCELWDLHHYFMESTVSPVALQYSLEPDGNSHSTPHEPRPGPREKRRGERLTQRL